MTFFSFFTNYLECLCFLVYFIALRIYYRKNKLAAIKQLSIYYLLITLLQLYGTVEVKFLKAGNVWVYDTVAVLTAAFISHHFYRLLESPRKKTTVVALFCIYLVYAVIHHATMEGRRLFDSIGYSILSASIAIYVFMFFHQMLQKVTAASILKDFNFWLASGYLFYFIGSFFIFVSFYYFTMLVIENPKREETRLLTALWGLHNVLLFISASFVPNWLFMDRLSEEVGIIVIASFFLLLVAVGIIALVMVYRRKQAEYIHEQTRMKAAFEKELLGAQLEIQEQTMKHIAQEIHDNIGGTLTLAKLNLNTIRTEQTNGSAEKIGNAKELVTKAIGDLRILSKTLHGEAVLSAGIINAIEMELKLIDKSASFDTSLSVSGTPVPIEQQKELILFRTVQEALNNAIKHSGATQIAIRLDYLNKVMKVSIIDNGNGMDIASIEKDPERGSGLRNMKNRTNMIGGEFLIDGSSGTKIQISLPIIAA